MLLKLLDTAAEFVVALSHLKLLNRAITIMSDKPASKHRGNHEVLTWKQMRKIDLEFWKLLYDPIQDNLVRDLWKLSVSGFSGKN